MPTLAATMITYSTIAIMLMTMPAVASPLPFPPHSLSKLIAMARFFGVSIDYLAGLED